jgi:hypothetical protein
VNGNLPKFSDEIVRQSVLDALKSVGL